MQMQRIITSNKKWIPQIDGLRFVAIAGTIIGHIFSVLYYGRGGYASVGLTPDTHIFWVQTLLNATRGVPLFYVISGFIIAQPFVRFYLDSGKPISTGAFYARRVTRLEPPYILSLFIYLAAQLAVSGRTHFNHLGQAFFLHLIYVHNFFPAVPTLNLVTWTLELEIQFYLLAPVFANIFRVRSSTLRRAILLAAILASAFLPTAKLDSVGFYFPTQLCFFLTGFLLADLRLHLGKGGTSKAWDLIAIFGFAGFLFVPERWGRFVFCIVLAALFTSALSGPFAKKLFGLRPIALIGGMCYSIYLYHMLVISIVFNFTHRLLGFIDLKRDYAMQLLLLIPPVMLVSVVFYLGVERPCMDPQWPSKLWRRIAANESRNQIETRS